MQADPVEWLGRIGRRVGTRIARRALTSAAGGVLVGAIAGGVAGALGELPRNDWAWFYAIRGEDGSPYLGRAILPRILGRRVLLHRIFRADADREPHNHPWRRATFLILRGGYVDERWEDGGRRIVRRALRPGDVNQIDAADFHRVTDVLPGTWTIGLVGERCQAWGFLVEGEGVVPLEAFVARKRREVT